MASSPRLYLVEVDIGYLDTSFEDFCKIWLDDINFYLEEQKAGRAKHLYKAAAERKVTGENILHFISTNVKSY